MGLTLEKNKTKARAQKARKETNATRKKMGQVEKVDNTKFNGFEITLLRKIKTEAFIGFRVMDMYPPPTGAFWGKFNDRKVDEAWVDKLADDFEATLDNCSNNSAIDVVVKTEWLEKLDQKEWSSVYGKTIEEVPSLTFTTEGQRAIRDNNLWVMSGNHRRLALNKFLEKATDEVRIKEAERKVLEANDLTRQCHGASVDYGNALNAEIEKQKKVIQRAHRWVVRVYDRGTQIDRHIY
jgi:hypothetical protein